MKKLYKWCCTDLLLKMVGNYFSHNRMSFWQELPHQTPCFKLIEDGLQTNTASAIHLQTWLSNILWYWTIAYSTKRVVHPLLATLGFSGPCITLFFCIGCYCIVTLLLLWIPVSSSNSNTFPFTYMTPSRLCFSRTPHNVSTLSIVQIAGQSVHATVNLEWQSHRQVNLPLLALQSSATPQVGG